MSAMTLDCAVQIVLNDPHEPAHFYDCLVFDEGAPYNPHLNPLPTNVVGHRATGGHPHLKDGTFSAEFYVFPWIQGDLDPAGFLPEHVSLFHAGTVTIQDDIVVSATITKANESQSPCIIRDKDLPTWVVRARAAVDHLREGHAPVWNAKAGEWTWRTAAPSDPLYLMQHA